MTGSPANDPGPHGEARPEESPETTADPVAPQTQVVSHSGGAEADEAGGVVEPAGNPAAPTVVRTRTGMFGTAGAGDTSGYGGLVRTAAMPGATPRPYGGWFDEFADLLLESLTEAGIGPESAAGAVEKFVVAHEELTVHVRREHLVEVCRRLRDEPDLRFELSLGVSGVHYPEDAGRELHAVYHLKSLTHGRRVRVEVSVPDSDPHLPSTTSVYPTHDWHEREAWDFFGLVFDGHPALTRIEMPDDWPGHPQRKDYPLGGIPVEYKGATVPPPDERRQYS